MIDSSYFELGQTKWRTEIEQRLKLFIQITSQQSKVQSLATITKLVKAK